MCLTLHSVSDTNIQRIFESPPMIWRLIVPDDPSMYVEEVKRKTRRGFFSRLFGKKDQNDSVEVPDLEFVEGENIYSDLDKSWQAIHYCLNKTDYHADPPMDFIITGGENCGVIDVGYGPARLIKSDTVKEIAQKISGITTDHLRQNYNPSKMEALDIYPNIWLRDGDEGFEYIAEYYEDLRSFIINCSKHNLGMALYFS